MEAEFNKKMEGYISYNRLPKQLLIYGNLKVRKER
jgi:hypothetical protein